MKKLTAIFSIGSLLLFSYCSSTQETDSTVVSENVNLENKAIEEIEVIEEAIVNSEAISFLNDSKSLPHTEGANPIEEFKKAADATATRSRSFNKRNAQSLLDDAKTFSHCAIIVENHTVIKINDYYDCKQSNTWDACMPIGEGYIKKGELEFQKDYISNIIGMPDKQKRTIYYFQ